MKNIKTLEGFGIMLGMIIGAGIFGLPYAFSKAPLQWNLLLFLAVFLISLLLHFLFAGIIYVTPGRHRFPGYVKKHLGHRAETIAAIFTILSSYGTMLAYGILGAIFLQNIFGTSFIGNGVTFFILGGLLFFFSLQEIGKINFYLTVPLLGFIILLAYKVMPYVDAANFIQPASPSWFFSYGVLVFALGGYTALPDLHDVLGHNNRGLSKKIIFWSLLVSALLYLVLILSVLGVSGAAVTPDALSGLKSVLGDGAFILGSIIGIFCVFRAYVIFGADLRLTFRYDYRLSLNASWLLAFLPPLTLFLMGFFDLVEILSIVGSVGLGVFAIFILLMVWKKKKEVASFLGFRPQLWWLFALGILIILGASQDLVSIYLWHG